MDGCELLKESGGALHALGRATWAAVRLRALQGRRVGGAGGDGCMDSEDEGVDNENKSVNSCVDSEDESVDNEDVCVDSGDGCMLTKRFPGPGPDRYLARFRSVAIAAVVAHPDR